MRREVLALRKENAALQAERAVWREEQTALERRVADLTALVERLQARIAILEKVSGSGPTTPEAPPPRSEPAPQAKPRGRPPGHPGASWSVPKQPAEVVDLPLSSCPDCGGELTEWRDTQDHVVVDLPEIAPVVRCYRHERGYCPHCHKTVRSPRAPDEPPHGHLGLRLLALMTLLRARAGVSYPKLSALLSDWGVRVGAGALSVACQRVASWLVPVHRELLAKIRDAPVKHADETSWPVDGRNGWLWTFVSQELKAYVAEPTRGAHVPRAVLGHDPPGILVSDFYGVYVWMGQRHQYCWAHLLREAREVAALGDRVAIRLREALCAIYQRAELVAVSQTALSRAALEREIVNLERRLSNLRKGQSGCAGVERIKNRLANFQEHLLTFVRHPEVEPTNNRAERALRPLVLVRKTTGGSRSWDGARSLAVLASCQQSLVRNGQDWLALLRTHVTSPASSARLASVLAD